MLFAKKTSFINCTALTKRYHTKNVATAISTRLDTLMLQITQLHTLWVPAGSFADFYLEIVYVKMLEIPHKYSGRLGSHKQLKRHGTLVQFEWNYRQRTVNGPTPLACLTYYLQIMKQLIFQIENAHGHLVEERGYCFNTSMPLH